jgi:hypothetical protein
VSFFPTDRDGKESEAFDEVCRRAQHHRLEKMSVKIPRPFQARGIMMDARDAVNPYCLYPSGALLEGVNQ